MAVPNIDHHSALFIPKSSVVAVAMSGGVDSSVAAAILAEQGYDVVGLTMHLWSDPKGEEMALNRASGCCSITMTQDAAAVAERMGFRHYVLNLSDEFHGSVVKNFAGEYIAGRTPNPCVRCNTFVKWQTLLDRALKMGCDYLATGHYARVISTAHRTKLFRSRNREKDQSYALWGLSQDALSRTLFPVGELTKHEVRSIASKLGLSTADKPESQDICFVPDSDYRRFLGDNFANELSVLQPGEIIGPDGEVLGMHTGICNYTVGQRKGLGIAGGRPLYVTKIDAVSNSIYVDDDERCLFRSATIREMNWVSIEPVNEQFDCEVKIRYRDEARDATVFQRGHGSALIRFHAPARAVTPGQSAVLYRGDEVLAGGVIAESELME